MPDITLDWADLLDALRTDECVLLLGPRAATYEGESLCDLLADRLALKLRQRDVVMPDGPPILAENARLFAEQFKNPADALDELRRILREFYAEFEGETIPVFDAVAALPFKYIINTSPDSLLLDALARQDKQARFFDFHFNNPDYNVEMNKRAINLDQEISEDTPLVFNLLGHYDRPDSLVLTNAERLRFLEIVLQREKEATLPPNIAFFFTKRPIQRDRKTYIFIGSDFNEWHMRLFLYLLGSKHGALLPNSISLQDPGKLQGDTHTFFTENFDVHFVADDPMGFLNELKGHLQQPVAAAPPARMELLLLYHPDDEPLREELETYLAPLRHGQLVDVWTENKIDPGADTEATLQEHLDSARLIVPLLTANFLANDRLFTEILPEVLTGSAKVAPIVMTPCDVEHTPLFELKTLNPKPRGRALSQKPDRQEALKAIVNDLRSMIERMTNAQPQTQTP